MVILLPIAIMIVACLLERFESTALPTPRPARRPRPLMRPAPPTPRLALVPDVDDTPAPGETPAPDAVPSPDAVPAAVVGLDADTMDLRRAS